ncbi:MAG: hypothetical protein JXA94_04565, partial [Parachlamydiales bacterium]|nr:hypothetical protein [Parachlamydiales bacterium]
ISEKKYVENFDGFQRIFKEYHLYSKKKGDIKFTVSFPFQRSDNLKCLILIDGLETGEDSLKYVPINPKDFVIVGYEYPKNLQKINSKTALFHIPEIRKAALSVSDQIIEVINFIENEPWYNKGPINIMGCSFGAIFVPQVYHLAQNKDIDLGPGVMAYGGAGLYDIFYANLSKYRILRAPMAYLAYLVFKPVDPVFHLPYIHGKFLIINGLQDKNIPLKAARKLQDMTPKPKTIINLDESHMAPDKTQLLKKIGTISLDWLEKN